MDSNPSIKNTYCIVKERRLIVEYHKGVGTYEDAMAFRKEQAIDPNFSPEFDIIADLRDLTFDVNVLGLKSLIEFYHQNRNLMGTRRTAIITETPMQVAFATIYKQLHTNLPQSLKIVSTIGAAVNWVGCEFTGIQVSEIIDRLKEKAEQ